MALYPRLVCIYIYVYIRGCFCCRKAAEHSFKQTIQEASSKMVATLEAGSPSSNAIILQSGDENAKKLARDLFVGFLQCGAVSLIASYM